MKAAWPKVAALIAAHLTQYLLWLASWVILGRIAVHGRADRVWFAAWAATLLAVVPFRVLGTWLQGLVSVDVGGFLKTRLLRGALQLKFEAVRHWGLGSFLSQALEAETVETLAVTGGIAGVLAVLEIVVAGIILGRFASVLVLWCVLSALLAAVFFARYRRWTGARMAMTGELIELMAGHRTRLAQQAPHRWHEGEAEALEGYAGLSRRLDRAGALLLGAIPRGWLLVGVASLAPELASGKHSFAAIAIPLGGMFLAWTAFQRLAGSVAELAAALTAWKWIAPLYRASGEGGAASPAQTAPSLPHKGSPILEAREVSFGYSAPARALQAFDLTIEQGERILLEGPSGGGKTTLVSILAGLRQPQAGELLRSGCVATAAQFHENYILTETLAFNLLMGRAWPPAPEDMEEAETVCRELGLGDLLDRMPGRLLQMVGEGGWQLSHGERSRIYIARALLQHAELVILDESFAALDPDTLNVALGCVLKRARTLLVVAHP